MIALWCFPSARKDIAVLFATLLFAATAHCHQHYLNSNPNGNTVGGGLGHTSSSGGGARNAYGNAFVAAGYQWTRNLCLAGSCASACLRINYYPAPHVTLCPADSDGDGQSNGFELGDPCCIWTSTSGNAQKPFAFPFIGLVALWFPLLHTVTAICVFVLPRQKCRRVAGAPQFSSDISNPGQPSSQTSRLCNFVCPNGDNPCRLPPAPSSSAYMPPATSTPPSNSTTPATKSFACLVSSAVSVHVAALLMFFS